MLLLTEIALPELEDVFNGGEPAFPPEPPEVPFAEVRLPNVLAVDAPPTLTLNVCPGVTEIPS